MYRHSVLVVLLVLPAVTQAQEENSKPTLVIEARGHLNAVNKVLFTPDGKQLVSVSTDKTIRLWDVSTGEPLQTLRVPSEVGGAGGQLHAAALSKEGTILAVAGTGIPGNLGDILLIDLTVGKVKSVLKGHRSGVGGLAFVPGGKHLVSVGGDIGILWDLVSEMPAQTFEGNDNSARTVAVSPDGKTVAIGTSKHTARLWSLATGELVATLDKHTDFLCCVAWSPDGKTLATSAFGSILLWNADGSYREKVPDEDGIASNWIWSLQFTADGQKLLYTNGGEGMAGRQTGILDLNTGKVLARVRCRNTMLTGALSPDGKLAASGGFFGDELRLWNTQDGSVVHRLAGKSNALYSVGWSRDGTTLSWGYQGYGADWGILNGKSRLQRQFNVPRLELAEVSDDDSLRASNSRDSLQVKKSSDGKIWKLSVYEQEKQLQSWDYLVWSCILLPERKIVTGGDYGRLVLLDIESGRPVVRYKGHAARINALAPSPDSKMFASVSTDQTLRVWRVGDEKPLLSLYVAEDEWIAWTPEGYYAASAGGEKLMGWHVENGPGKLATFYPAAQFRKTLYRPDVIKLLLETGSVEKALEKADKARGKASQRTEIDKVLPPKVAITSPDKTGLKMDKPELEVKAVAESVGENPVTALRLLIDGRPHQGEAGIQKIADPKPGKAEASWTVKIEPGKHALSVQAESAVSKAVSDEVEVIGEGTRGLGKTPEQLPDKTDLNELPSLYVLAVGVSAYKGDRKLNYAAKDAESLAKVCQEKSKALFRQVEVKLITDEKATRREILQGLTWLRKQMTQRDVGMIFFAGHGMKDSDSSFYLLPIDGDPDDLLSTAVPGEQVKRTLASVPGKIMVLLDACHAGSADGGEKRRAATSLTDDLVRDLVTDDYGVIVMCSSMGREYSLESAAVEHGYFTLALTEGLSGKAANKDGVVYLHTLDAYVTDRVKELSKGRQHPVTAKPSTIRSFPLSKP